MKSIAPKFANRMKLSAALLFLVLSTAGAQMPQNIPNENTPTDWSSWLNILIFVLLPVAIVLFFLFYRRQPRGPEEDI